MPALSDQMLMGGCAVLVESLHGETIFVLSGCDAGKSFICVRETEADITFDGDLGPDPRAKRVLRFRDGGAIPRLNSQDKIRTEDGKVWTAVLRPDDGYLSTDFEIVQFIPVVKPGRGNRQQPVNADTTPGLQDVRGNTIEGVGGETIDQVG